MLHWQRPGVDLGPHLSMMKNVHCVNYPMSQASEMNIWNVTVAPRNTVIYFFFHTA